MKKPFLNLSKSIFLVLFMTLITASCSSDDSEPAPVDPAVGLTEFSVLVNGGQYIPNEVFGFQTVSNVFTIVTTEANGEGVNISIPSDQVGTYTVTDGIFDDFILTYTESGGDFFVSTSGTLTITDNIQVDATKIRVKGTFTFAVVDTNGNIVYELTDGSFDLEYLSI